jgi:hypothetical protein
MRTLVSKQSFKKVISKVREVKLIATVIQEVLYVLFNLIYGTKPLFVV